MSGTIKRPCLRHRLHPEDLKPYQPGGLMPIPESTLIGLIDYAENGVPVGCFLHAVLSNNLMGAYSKADEHNYAALARIVGFCYNVLPSNCWGSPEKVMAWLNKTADLRREEETHR